MIQALLQPEVQDFLSTHEDANVQELLLRHQNIQGVPASVIADQLIGRRKAKDKLPRYYKERKVVYPKGLNLEQSSSERTAAFKAEFIRTHLNTFVNAVDLTGGFGVDTLHFAPLFDSFHYVEPNEALLEIARYNHEVFGASNIHYHHTTAEEFLGSCTELSFAFIDPSRRSNTNQKVFSFQDCAPDIVELQPQIFDKSNYLLVKASPFLDISIAMKELKNVKLVTVVAVDNECKEILFFADKEFNEEPTIQTVDLHTSSASRFDFLLSEEKTAQGVHASVKVYLYEPNAAIMKSGAFKVIGQKFSLEKLHPSTHLYTANTLNAEFPGRVFKVIQEVKPDPRVIHQLIPEGKANVTTRNYPMTVDELKKKTKLKDGGDRYLIGFTDINKSKVVIAERIK